MTAQKSLELKIHTRNLAQCTSVFYCCAVDILRSRELLILKAFGDRFDLYLVSLRTYKTFRKRAIKVLKNRSRDQEKSAYQSSFFAVLTVSCFKI